MALAALPLQSRVETVETLFMSGRFEPAAVQRDYQWRRSHCQVMLADLDRTFASSVVWQTARQGGPVLEPPPEADTDSIDGSLARTAPAPASGPLDYYVLGAIVVTPAQGGMCRVFDGLQRLTTLTVLVAVLRDLITEAALKARLDRLIRTETRAFRVRLSGRDQILADQVQPLGAATRERRGKPKTDMGARIRIARDVFLDGLRPWGEERRVAFATFLLEHVLIDVQEVRDERLARQMFITGNLRGKRLDRIDLLKGQLTDIAADDAAANRVVTAWNAARQQAGDRFEGLLISLDLIERQQPQSEDCLNELAEYVAANYGPAGIETWLERLSGFVTDDAALEAALKTPANDVLSADLWRLQLFRWTEWRPLALLWLADARRQRGDAAKNAQRRSATLQRFNRLHRVCMGVTLAGFSPADREKIFIRAVGQVINGMSPFAANGALSFKVQQIEKIAETLRTPITDREIRTTLIRWFESLAHIEAVPLHVRDASVEHILPQRVADVPQWIVAFPDRQQRFLHCNALGNLAAIDKGRNMKLRNLWYPKKVPIYASAAKDFVTLRDLSADIEWSPAVIQERTERLAAAVEAGLGLTRFSGR